VTITYFKLKNKGSDDFSFLDVSKTAIHYGTPLLLNYFYATFWPEVQKIGIGFVSSGGTVAGYNVGVSYSTISKSVMVTTNSSLLVSFSRVYSNQQIQKLESIYNLILKYSLFIVCLVTGVLFILTDFSLKLIFTEQLAPYSIFLRILLLAIPFQILISPFDANLSALNKTKLIAPIKIFTIIIQLACFFSFLVIFNVLGAIIGLLVADMINFIFYLLLHYKVEKIKIQLKKFLFQFVIFFGTIFIISGLEFIGLSAFYRNLVTALNLSLLIDLPIFSLILFLIIFFSLNFAFKIITKRDMESLEGLFGQKGILNWLIRKVSQIIKKIAFF
jgi:O-antigen/teichoic acid export membrane protein